MIRPKFLRAARAALALVAGFGALDAAPLLAQAAPVPYTSATRYDALGRVTGTIAPDPDGVAPFAFIAVRSTYDSAGNPIKVEKGVLSAWQAETIAPKDWTGFTIDSTVDSTFDALGRKLTERVRGSDLAVVSLTQFSYTASGQVKCTAVRMNPAAFAAPPADACALGTPASVNGATVNDRIIRNSYVLGDPTKLEKIEQAVGTPSQRDYVRYTYTANGKQLGVIDARGMLATYSYDGFDRLKRWTFPSKDMALSPSAIDFEEYDYDLLGNLTERRLRDHTAAAPSRITYTHDALRRQTTRAPTGEHPVTYGYDLRGLLTSENRPGDGQSLAYTYDGFGRLTAEAQPYGTMTYGYDLNGNRRKITWADGLNVVYQYDQLNRVTRIRENNAASGIGVLATYSYTPTGQRAAVTYGNGTSRSYAYDTAGRTTGVKLDLAGGAHDLTIGAVAEAGTPVSYNPAGQIVSLSRSNDLYAWTAHSLFERDYVVNGINQYTSAGGVTLGHDGRGNLTTSGSSTYGYSRLNELTSAPNPLGGTIQLTYDPKGRLTQVNAGTPVRMVYAGPNLVTETGQTGTVLRRYVPGPGNAPLVWYEGPGATDRRWLHTDQLGSVVAISNASGAKFGINSYDEYGIPFCPTGSTGLPDCTLPGANIGRFQYTGQTWWGELGLYHYKARWYSASLGRFMQTDLIGYKDNLNLYAYVGNDPVNGTDPTGMAKVCESSQGGIRNCVYVDGDGDGNGKDNDLSRRQMIVLSRQFAGFIASHNGADLSKYGKPVFGSSSEFDKGLLRATSQFVGAAVSGTRDAEYWAQVPYIYAGKDLGMFGKGNCAGTVSYECTSMQSKFIAFTGMRWSTMTSIYSPSESARLLFHGIGHLSLGPLSGNPSAHRAMDADAVAKLRQHGLDGGGCSGDYNMLGDKIGMAGC